MDKNGKTEYFCKRIDNFVNNSLPNFDYTNPILQKKLNYFFDLKEEFFKIIESVESLNENEILIAAFSHIYNSELFSSVINQPFQFDPYKKSVLSSNLSQKIYEACLFFALFFFLHNTKRCKHKSLRDFIYFNSPNGYTKKESINNCNKNAYSTIFEAEEATFRKYRNRLFSKREYNDKVPQWYAMRKDSEFEWGLYFELNFAKNDNPVFDIFKRLGNLNNDIIKIINSDNIETTPEEIENAYKKFFSKLNKIKYTNYLEISKYILDRIYDNKLFYGVNIYRLEKEFRIFENINAVDKLLKCKSLAEEEEILIKGYCLRDIWFPKVHIEFEALTYNEIPNYVQYFFNLLNFSNFFSCFIFDELVEKNKLGEDWENVIYDVLNNMAECVFYTPSNLNFLVSQNSQKKFVKYLSSDVKYILQQYWHTHK